MRGNQRKIKMPRIRQLGEAAMAFPSPLPPPSKLVALEQEKGGSRWRGFRDIHS